jgi:arsenite methyltransferase
MHYTGELAQIQQAASQTADYAARRAAAFAGLAPRAGEHILEVGCGSGLFIKQVAEAVGPSGRAHAVDVSKDQIAVARSTCSGLSTVELRVASALDLPYSAGAFDAVASIQVLEYIDDVDRALRELRRVLIPTGRFVNFATNWDAVFWNSRSPDRERQILDGWRKHAPFPNLPAVLRPRLEAAGFVAVRQSPVSILNTTYDTDTYSYWLAHLVAAFVVESQLAAPETAAAWLDDLADAVERDEYMFCSMAVVTSAVASQNHPRQL